MIASEVKKELTEQKTRSVFMLDNIEEERRRISRELHDGIGQILFAAKFNLEVFEKDSNINNKNVAEAKNLITSANKELRRITSYNVCYTKLLRIRFIAFIVIPLLF